MNALIDAAINRTRPVLLMLALILFAGTSAYLSIPKEAEPDVAIPIIYVSVFHEGISPEDAERLLVRPLETELRGLEGLKELRATASEGRATVILEFEAGFDSDQALSDVRERVDIAKAELPAETEEPSVNEVNVALFPVLVVTLYGDIPERTLIALARDLRDTLESLPGVLEVDIAGDREELLEVIVDPLRLENYGLSQQQVLEFVRLNNQLVAAGSLDPGAGRFSVKVPGVIENLDDVLNIPVKVDGTRVVTVQDVAIVRRTFKDATGFARVNGQPAVALEVSKRIGANIIDTLEQVKSVVSETRQRWPEQVKINYSQDRSEDVRTMLYDLQNNVLAAVILVMIVIVAALGARAAGLVGVAIPGSFLAGILILAVAGLTINIVVLFSLIMAVGMLVDGAIVVTELADRKMSEGLNRRDAYAHAAKRMAWPITASTATTLAAFAPLLFWPGVVGEFMKYLPFTLIATLGSSLLMALIFIPTLGSLVGRRGTYTDAQMAALVAAESGDLNSIGGLTGTYLKVLRSALRHAGKVVLATVALLVGVYALYGQYGRGVEFFPQVEPENAVIHVRARGDMSVLERDRLVREVEARISGVEGIESAYARTGLQFRSELPEDVIGVIQLELTDWETRPPAAAILDDIRHRTASVAGVNVEIQEQEAGPPVGKPVQLELSARDPELLDEAVVHVRRGLNQIGGFIDVTDTRPIPGIEWLMRVDRTQASRFGADVATVGSAVQLVTNGIKVGEYRPNDADDQVDIRVRFPFNDRDLQRLDRLRVQTGQGMVPISNFVERVPAPRVGNINRADGRRVLSVEADLPEGVLPEPKIRQIRQWLAAHPLPGGVSVAYKGEDEERRQAQGFLSNAFIIALFLMAIILVTQFNSVYQAVLVLSAVVFSTIGVLLGLLTTGQPFGIVMTGVGVIALAGIVVNNNIVLIDTFNILRRGGNSLAEAILRTGALRLRPVFLTTITTVLGLMPMMLGVNIDITGRDIEVGAPSAQWWMQLATAVAGGLTFATVLTLILTPCLLLLGDKLATRMLHIARRRLHLGQSAAH